jgi:DNA adenine methylase
MFPAIHERLHLVQIDNQDWYDCIMDYDAPDTVFYLDPPYLMADPGIYKYNIDHHKLIQIIFTLQGFVALSGYANPTYDKCPWDGKHEWDSYTSIESTHAGVGNYKQHLDAKRSHGRECLWIKEFS